MIFRTITDESTGAISSISLFGKSIRELKDTFSSIKANGIINTFFNTSTIDTKAVINYNAEIEKATANGATMAEKQQIMQSAMKGTNRATSQLIGATNGATVSTEALTAAQHSSTIAAKAQATALKAASIAGNMILFTAIAKGIQLAATAIDDWIHRVEKANEAMDEAVGEYESAKSSLENINSELDEQNKELDELLAKDKFTYAEKGQLEELQAITQELLLQQDIEQRRADNASKEAANKAVDAYQKQYGKYDKTEDELKEKLSYENFPLHESTDDVIGMIAAYIRAKELLEQSQKDYDNALENGEDTTWLAEELQSNIDAIDDYSQALDENISDLQEKRVALENEYNKAIEKRNSGIEPLTSSEKEVIETYESIYDLMRMVYEYTNQNAWNNMEISNIFNTKGIEKTKEELIAMAEIGRLTPEYIAENFKVLNKAIQDSEIFLENGQTAAEAFCEEIYRTSDTAIQFRDALSSAKSKFGDTFKLEINTDELIEAKENLEYELEKLSDWNLEDYSGFVQHGVQSIFGNIDMDKRTIITWSDELKQTYADALASWDYDPEIGGIDTVFGGSSRFGEEINGTGWEVAFTPILPDGTFLSSDTVYEYIESIVGEAYAKNGEVTEDALKSIDAQGRQIGNTFVHGIFAAVDDSLEYDNNKNLAETVGRLMHFTGDFGAVKLAKQEIEEAKELIDWDSWFSKNVKTPQEIEIFQKIIEEANNAADAVEKYNTVRTSFANENPISLSINEMVNQLNTRLKPAFDSLGSAYQDIFTTDGFNIDAVDIPMLEDLRSTLEDLNEAEDLDISIDMGAFDDFSRILTDTTTTEKEAQQAFDDLATSLFYATSATEGISEETVKLVEQLLESLGVTNAEEVAIYALRDAKAQAILATYDLAEATRDGFVAILDEGEAANLTRQEIYNLTAAEIAFGQNTLSTEQKIEQLHNLATAYGDTASAALATAIANDLASGHTDVDSAINDLMAKINSGVKKVNLDFSSAGKSSSKSKSSSKKDTTETFDWIEQAIENVEKKVKELDDVVNSSYSTFSQKNEALAQEIEKVNEDIDLQQQAYEKYMQKAESIALSDDYKVLVRDGAINIENISDEKLKTAISDYQKWYDKAISVSDAISDLKEQLKDLHVAGYELNSDRLKELLDSEAITEKQYIEEMTKLYEKYYENQTEYAVQAHEAKLALLEEEKSYLNSVANATASLLDKEIDKIQDNAKEQEKIYQKQIDILNGKKKPLEDELDALEDKAKKENLILGLQEKQYNLKKLENQRDKLVNYMPDTIVI